RRAARRVTTPVAVEEVPPPRARRVPHLVDPDHASVTEPERVQPIRDGPPRWRRVPPVERMEVVVDDPRGPVGRDHLAAEVHDRDGRAGEADGPGPAGGRAERDEGRRAPYGDGE